MLKVCLFVCRSLCSLSRHSVEEEFPHLYAAGCNLRDVCSDCTKFVVDVISSSRRSLDIINNTPKRNKRTTSTHPHPTSQPHAFCRMSKWMYQLLLTLCTNSTQSFQLAGHSFPLKYLPVLEDREWDHIWISPLLHYVHLTTTCID